MRPAGHGFPEWELIAVIVGIVKEPALLDDEPTCIHAGAIAAIPAERPFADRCLQRRDGLADMLALLGFGQLVVLDPAPTMAADIEARCADRVGRRPVALQRERTAKHGHRQAALMKQPHQAPETDATAIFEHALRSEIPALDALVPAGCLRVAGLGEILAVLDRRLRTLLVVHHKIDCQAGSVRPFWIWRAGAVAD